MRTLFQWWPWYPISGLKLKWRLFCLAYYGKYVLCIVKIEDDHA